MSLAGPLRYIGGKFYLAKWHVSLFPAHSLFVTLCGGGLSEIFAKEAANEIINDCSGSVINFWRVLRDHTEEFVTKCMLTPLSRELIDELNKMPPPADPIDRAWRFFMMNRQAFSGTGASNKNVKWSISKRVRRNINESTSALISSVDKLPEVADRLRMCALECGDAVEVFQRHDDKHTFFYVDPPYYIPDCGEGGSDTNEYYESPFPRSEHIRFANAFRNAKGKVMVCGFYGPFYRELYQGWRVETQEVALNASSGDYKGTRIEAVYLNY